MAGLGPDMLPKPMVFDCIVLRVRGHQTRFEPGQHAGTNIVFVNPHAQIGDTLDRQAAGIAKYPDHIHNAKQVLAGSAKSNILGLHGGQCNLSLKTGFQKNRQPKAIIMKPM
jgi:hypothetical protein